MEDSEYTYNIKRKIELVLQVLIEKYHLEGLISSKLRYRIDFDSVMQNPLYKLFEQRKRANGEMYNVGTEYAPEGFQQWLWFNFPDYMTAAQIYDHISKTSYITQEDLKILNGIYQKHHKNQQVTVAA